MKRFLSGAVTGAALIGGGVMAAAPAAHAAITVQQVWGGAVLTPGSADATSSPVVANLDGRPSAVFGDQSGHVFALHLSDGSEVGGWPVATGAPVDTAPAVAGTNVYIGVGNAANTNAGGLAAYASNGATEWFRAAPATPAGGNAGVDTSPAVGNLQGQTDVVSGSMGQFDLGVNAANGSNLGGWPFFSADSTFSSPALADVYSNGRQDVVIGGDSTYGNAEGQQYYNGGHLRVIGPNGALSCAANFNQVIQSSPAVGQILGGGGVGIAVGVTTTPETWQGGQFYPGPSNTADHLYVLSSNCAVQRDFTLDGYTGGSPTLVNALGNGHLQVVEGTNSGPGNGFGKGTIWVLDAVTGTAKAIPALGGILGSVVSIDLGAGHQDLVAATTAGAEIVDPVSGAVLWTGLQGVAAFQDSPLVTDDPNGTIGLTFAGYNNNGTVAYHFSVAGSNGATVSEAGSWPMFHHDPQLTGDAGTPPPTVEVPCSAPSGGPNGYWLGASDGGIFTFGNVPFCGSTGNLVLNQPIVGMAGTRDGGGYWLVARDGGIFTFGDASYHGSTGNIHLNQPIVAMARTPGGGGYWLVASDGGIFSFGDAAFHGSTGNIHLNQPIVGMAPTKDGQGYWLVARDGGIFSFGDATFHGSTGNIHLNQPIVGMAATPDGGGYWLVASDGGIFSFGDAAFHGSTGGMHLNRPVIGMTPTANGGGYWLYAGDGGIFTFGDATYHGSTGNIHLNQPIVSMAGY